MLLFVLFLVVPCQAVNDVFMKSGTPIVWTDAGTGGDELLDAGGLAADGVVMGSFADLGSGARSEWYSVELLIDGFDTDPVVGEGVEVWFSQSIATTNFDGNPTTDPTTTAEGTMTVAQLQNTDLVGAVLVYAIAQADELKATFNKVNLTSRYVSMIIHNNTVDALESTSEAHKVTLTPVSIQIQDAP